MYLCDIILYASSSGHVVKDFSYVLVLVVSKTILATLIESLGRNICANGLGGNVI